MRKENKQQETSFHPERNGKKEKRKKKEDKERQRSKRSMYESILNLIDWLLSLLSSRLGRLLDLELPKMLKPVTGLEFTNLIASLL